MCWVYFLDKNRNLAKLKDDPDLLKKNLKRKEGRKAKSRKKWQDRQRTVTHHKAEKQEKRRMNLEKRVDAKRQKSVEIAKKKGRFVPGF